MNRFKTDLWAFWEEPYPPYSIHLISAKANQEGIEFTNAIEPKRIYNSITSMGYLAMFTFQLDKTRR